MPDNALAKTAEQQIADYGTGLLEVISRAARDPSVDIDKMERLIAMQERVQARDAEVAFSVAFAAMQPDLPSIARNGQIVHKGQVISDFAEWEDINRAITPVLSAHGFSLSFKPQPSGQGERVSVTAILRHRGGHKDEATLSLPMDTSGAKNAVQSVGSTLSYSKRYAAILILNLTTEGDDDDGSKAGPKRQHDAPRDAPFPDGPARNKTELKAMGRDYWRDIEACEDDGQLAGLRNRALEAQLRAAMPTWWNGGSREGGEPFDGLGDIIHRLETQFATQGAQP